MNEISEKIKVQKIPLHFLNIKIDVKIFNYNFILII